MKWPHIEPSLTDRQRLICLLMSAGQLDKQIAQLLDTSQRTVEHEKRHVAGLLKRETRFTLIWAVENRRTIREGVQDWASAPASVRKLIETALA